MKTQSAKAKGRRLQKLVVAKILDAFPHLSARDVQSRSMGAGGEDVCLSKAAYNVFPFTVECKNQEVNKTFLKMWAQAKANTQCDDVLLVLSANNSPTVAIMDINYLFNLIKGKTGYDT